MRLFKPIEHERSVPCPVCQVAAGEKCTAPTDMGRREVEWVHLDREVAADEAEQEQS